jgi:hypothetical protein
MRCNSANMLMQASRAIDPEKDVYAYAFALEDMAGHIRQVRAGTVTLDEFADFYMIRPEATESAS